MENVRGHHLGSLTCMPSAGSAAQGKGAPDAAAVKTFFDEFLAKFEPRITLPAAG